MRPATYRDGIVGDTRPPPANRDAGQIGRVSCLPARVVHSRVATADAARYFNMLALEGCTLVLNRRPGAPTSPAPAILHLRSVGPGHLDMG
ncbi:hypothetical protein PMIN01_07042 [Paraphaeosphaeria minitans]|uniref:Uncharacterized protein n=1 Tax=Paraphaeosphaeria minitans TaxID=565426 RepID=A0A9P6KQY5_9PLEO|nr:hypothetical protein PMIN01_07042 [Paraphaeosphaeria minitans]